MFLLAEAGLLDRREATTHWALAESFTLRYPEVILRPELVLCDQGDVVTAGGVTAYLDLRLHMAARLASPDLASTCAKRLLETTGMGVEELAASVGYADPASFRRLFKSMTGLSPGAYRMRFRLP
jgi:transcriptional regulator GlxA family with amidase domain